MPDTLVLSLEVLSFAFLEIMVVGSSIPCMSVSTVFLESMRSAHQPQCFSKISYSLESLCGNALC